MATSKYLQVWCKDSNLGIFSNIEEKYEKSFSEEKFNHQLTMNRIGIFTKF